MKVLAYNPNNFNALCYRAKALIALNNNEEALKYIKQALSIKYNKTLFKYLTDIEKRQRKLSDEMLFNKLNEQHLKNLESNNLDSTSRKISYDKEKLNQSKSKRNSKDSSDSKHLHKKQSNFKEVTINIKENKNANKGNNNNLYIKDNFKSKEDNPTYENVNNADNIKNNNYSSNINFEKNQSGNNKDKINFVKILNETSLNTNLISDNGNCAYNNTFNTFNNNNKENKDNKDYNNTLIQNQKANTDSGYSSSYSGSRILKMFKIMFMYLVQYLRKHKAIVCLLALIFLFMKRKSIVVILRKILSN